MSTKLAAPSRRRPPTAPRSVESAEAELHALGLCLLDPGESIADRQEAIDEARTVLVHRQRRDERALGWPEAPSACAVCSVLGFAGGKLWVHGPCRLLAEQEAAGHPVTERLVCATHETIEVLGQTPPVVWRGPRSEWLQAAFKARGWEP